VVRLLFDLGLLGANGLAVEYPEMPRGAERDLFQRVQLGMALTAAGTLLFFWGSNGVLKLPFRKASVT